MKGVLLMAYGSPDSIDNVQAYYTDIRHGVAPPDKLLEEVKRRYGLLGGKTPLNEITRKQANALQDLLDKECGREEYKVFTGMKHWQPLIRDTIQQITDEGITEVIALVLSPHYSRMSIEGYKKLLDDAVVKHKGNIHISFIDHWHTNKYFIDSITGQLQIAKKTHFPISEPYVLLTAHSLPERIVSWNDPYPDQLKETAELVAQKLHLIKWQFAFQSQGMTGEKWLGQDPLEILAELQQQGQKEILFCPIGFVADNLEILYDIDILYQETAQKLGMKLRRTQSRNTHPKFIQALFDLVIQFS